MKILQNYLEKICKKKLGFEGEETLEIVMVFCRLAGMERDLFGDDV